MSKTLSISNYVVLKSAAGYYIGRYCVEKDNSGWEYSSPYDRASGYYATEEAAKKDLPKYKEVQ